MTRYGAAFPTSYPVRDPSLWRTILICELEEGCKFTVVAERKWIPGHTPWAKITVEMAGSIAVTRKITFITSAIGLPFEPLAGNV